MNKLNKPSNDKWRWLFQLRVYSDQRTDYAAILLCLIYFPSHDRNELGWLRLQTRWTVGGSTRSLKKSALSEARKKNVQTRRILSSHLLLLLLLLLLLVWLIYKICLYIYIYRCIYYRHFTVRRLVECTSSLYTELWNTSFDSTRLGWREDLREKHQQPSLHVCKVLKYALLLK